MRFANGGEVPPGDGTEVSPDFDNGYLIPKNEKMEFLSNFGGVPPKSRPGPKKGSYGKKSKIWTPEKLEELRNNPGRWIILYEGATVNENSNAIQYTRRHTEFKTVCRKLPDNPPNAPLTIFALYTPEDKS